MYNLIGKVAVVTGAGGKVIATHAHTLIYLRLT